VTLSEKLQVLRQLCLWRCSV